MTELPGYYLLDNKRSAFGLGWEHCRRKISYDNPFEASDWRHEAFAEGYASFQPPKVVNNDHR